MKKGAKGKNIQIYMFSSRLIIINTNEKYMTKEIENNYAKVKYQLFSHASSKEAH